MNDMSPALNLWFDPTKCFIGGQWVPAVAGETLPLENPSDGSTICDIARGLGASVATIDGIGQLARAQQTMRNVAGPVVFDVRIDHTIQMAKKDRVAAFTTPPRESKPALRVIN